MFRTLFLLVQAVLSIYGSVYAAYASRILNERKVSISIRDVGVNTMLYFKAKNNHLPLWIMYEPAAKAMARDAALSAVCRAPRSRLRERRLHREPRLRRPPLRRPASWDEDFTRPVLRR